MAGLSFLPLLAQSLGVKLSGMEEGTPPQYQNGIEVSGATPQQQPMESLLPQQAPARQDTPVDLSGVRGRQLSQEEYRRSLPYENLPEHKGMFGLKGTLRDVVGMLGDAFLVQSGNKAVYAPQRQQEKAGDALLGMGPGQERDAIARVMQVDPEAGMKMFKDWQDRNLTADSISQRRESDQITAQNHALSNTEKGIKLLGMAAGATTPETWDQMSPIMRNIVSKYQLGEEYDIGDQYDENRVAAFATGGMPVNQQITTQQGDRRLTETKRHNLANEGLGAQRNKISASKGSQGRAQTDLEFFKEVGSIPPEKRTQAQKDFYRKYTEGVKKSRRGGVAIPPASGSSRFRPIRD